MPFSNIGTYACRALQANYVDFYKMNAAQFKTGGSTALIKYLLSPQNTLGFKQIDVTSVPGKKRPVAFLVDNPYCFTVSNPAVNCNTPKEYLTNPSKELVFDLTGPAFRLEPTPGTKKVLQFTREDMAKYCTETDQSYMQRHIIRYLIEFEEQLDKELCKLILPSVGTDANGNAITNMPFFNQNTITNSSVLNPDALWWLEQNYADIMGQGQYAMVGGQVLNKIMSLLKWSGLNAAGIDLTKVDDTNPYSYYDRNMDLLMGKSDFLQLSPGAVQLVSYNENAGPYKSDVTDLYSNGTIVLPTTGLMVDWDWRYDYECKAWTFEAYVHLELAVNKAGGCGNLATTNGIIRYHDCSNSIAMPVCPV